MVGLERQSKSEEWGEEGQKDLSQPWSTAGRGTINGGLEKGWGSPGVGARLQELPREQEHEPVIRSEHEAEMLPWSCLQGGECHVQGASTKQAESGRREWT